MSDDKPVVEFYVNDVDSVWIEPGIQGALRVLLCTDHAQDVALRLPLRVLAILESKFEEVRASQQKSSSIQ